MVLVAGGAAGRQGGQDGQPEPAALHGPHVPGAAHPCRHPSGARHLCVSHQSLLICRETYLCSFSAPRDM